MAIGTKLGRLSLRNWVRPQDIKPALTETYIPSLTYASTLPLPRGHLAGCKTTRVDAQDVSIAVGQARASGDDGNILVTSAITKQIDADWAEGTNQGGFPQTALTLTASTWYHYFLLGKADNSGFDAGWDTSLTATNLLGDAAVTNAGYTTYRRVASHLINSGGTDVLTYVQSGRTFWWGATHLTDLNGIGTATVLSALTGIPTGIEVDALVNISGSDATATLMITTSPHAGDEVPSTSAAPLYSMRGGSAATTESSQHWVRTDTSARIRSRWTNDPNTYLVAVLAWRDELGTLD